MTAERVAKKAAKVAKSVAGTARVTDEVVTGKKTRVLKLRVSASAADPKAKMARISESLAKEGEREAGAPESEGKPARTSNRLEPLPYIVAHAEGRTVSIPWRSPVAQMW